MIYKSQRINLRHLWQKTSKRSEMHYSTWRKSSSARKTYEMMSSGTKECSLALNSRSGHWKISSSPTCPSMKTSSLVLAVWMSSFSRQISSSYNLRGFLSLRSNARRNFCKFNRNNVNSVKSRKTRSWILKSSSLSWRPNNNKKTLHWCSSLTNLTSTISRSSLRSYRRAASRSRTPIS